MFRAWVGVDEATHTHAQATDFLARGLMGKLIHSVNDRPVNVELKQP
jgi:hypothetical protein